MNTRPLVKCALLSVVTLLSTLFSSTASAQNIDIAPMTWATRSDQPQPDQPKRSDWINVKTDPNVSPHARGNGLDDDTDAIQSALTLAASTGNRYIGKKTVYLPPGTYKISRTLTWQNVCGGAMIGCGKDTILKWYGPSGAPMFWSQGNTRTRFIGMAWDGNGIASCGYLHMSWSTGDMYTSTYESRMRHENESFKNFVVSGTYSAGQTLPAAGIMSGLSDSKNYTAETMVWNCLFYNCTNGAVVGYKMFNFYMWLFDGCEFENCGTGISGSAGKIAVTNCHFENSSVSDLGQLCTQRVRHCTSVGSSAFVLEQKSGGTSMGVFQDCWVDGWTGSNGAIQFGIRGPDNVFDCVFTHPPAGAQGPIHLVNLAGYPMNLILSNNYAPGFSNMVYGSTSYQVVVPSGSLTSSLTSPKQTFLQSAPIVEGTNILDVSQPPYNVILGGTNDCTAAIQQAIDYAKAANNGSIVYLPMNAGYRISSPLNLSGSNYKLQGSGFYSKLIWTGAATGGTMISVTNPQNLAMEQLQLQGTDNTTNMVVQTSSGASTMTYDGVYTCYSGTYACDGPGVVFSKLPASSVVYAPHLDSPLTVDDCGPAQIFMKYLCMGQVTVKGATRAKTGFLGAAIAEGGQGTPTGYNITVNDNQDLVIGDYYDEQTYNDLNLQRGNATGVGRVTIQGFKEHAKSPSTQINVNNYAGRLMYGPQMFINGDASSNTFVSPIITHTGTTSFDLILPGNVFFNCFPAITKGTGCNLIQVGNLRSCSSDSGNSVDYIPNTPTSLTTADLSSMAASFDHLRQLGAVNLAMDYGLAQIVTNPGFETDAVNPDPATTYGYQPAGWDVTSGTTIGSGVRNFTVASGGSPFSTGTQSLLVIDTTGTATGNYMLINQYTRTTLPADQGAVLTFDFRLNSGTGVRNDNWVGIWAGNTRCSCVHILGNNSGGTISANVGGSDHTFGAPALAVNTWYRVRVVLGAPSAGKSNATLWLTPWAGSKPGKPTSYTIDGVPSVSASGYSSVFLKQTFAGQANNLSVDNVMIQNGTFDFPSLP